MFKLQKIQPPAFVTIYDGPHNNLKVLHAPGECPDCDRYPYAQQLRLTWGIAFTGYTPEGKEIACPSEKIGDNRAAQGSQGNQALEKDFEIILELEPSLHCGWCGQTYGEHTDALTTTDPLPRVPCGLLKSKFLLKAAPEKKLFAGHPGTRCALCGYPYMSHFMQALKDANSHLACRLLRSEFKPDEVDQARQGSI